MLEKTLLLAHLPDWGRFKTVKTLTFFILILMKKADGEERTSIIVTPLNLLGRQMEADMKNSEVTTIAVSHDTETAKTHIF